MGSQHIHALTPDRWTDLEALFGANGAVGGCWCMWWRLPSKEFTPGAVGGPGRKAAFRDVVESAVAPPGLLAYRDEQAVGWVAVAPLGQFERVLRSTALEPADGVAETDLDAIWSINCFFIRSGHRRTGLGRALLEAAVDLARQNGAHEVEGYPNVEWKSAGNTFTGIRPMFEAAGFTDIALKKPGARVRMRRPCR